MFGTNNGIDLNALLSQGAVGLLGGGPQAAAATTPMSGLLGAAQSQQARSVGLGRFGASGSPLVAPTAQAQTYAPRQLPTIADRVASINQANAAQAAAAAAAAASASAAAGDAGSGGQDAGGASSGSTASGGASLSSPWGTSIGADGRAVANTVSDQRASTFGGLLGAVFGAAPLGSLAGVALNTALNSSAKGAADVENLDIDSLRDAQKAYEAQPDDAAQQAAVEAAAAADVATGGGQGADPGGMLGGTLGDFGDLGSQLGSSLGGLGDIGNLGDTSGLGGAADLGQYGSESGGGSSSSGESSCFLTTAAVHCLGLPDNCDELQTLRAFRDRVMCATPEGAADVATYYATAPGVVRAVDARQDAALVWRRMWAAYIVPAVAAIRAGDDAGAYRIYRRCAAWAARQAFPSGDSQTS
ncbi:CFI-box-CTERM domain-containing protein [Pseudaquabacterium rugosum]|uniref:CFI-box-CTERM domain-containing protein n=1 Tax=Pseudaquabacterium rugosum TaxID=2984194 RepID=A0ABU9B623_9BURK